MWPEYFAYQGLLFLLVIPPLLAVWHFLTIRRRTVHLKYSHSLVFRNVRKNARVRLKNLPVILRLLVITLLILVIARPQSTTRTHQISVEGIDIMIALDISGSMLAEDFSPNRMEAAKQTAIDFIDMRPGDRIGVSVFSGESFTLCPLTTDHALIKELTKKVGPGMVRDGTAIGDGLATAINRLRDSEAESRVIVLLTDGINNTGAIDPLTAADIAALYDIRVYTIGVGSSGPVPYPFETPFGIQYRDVEIPVDEELLQSIAGITGGEYFWAETQNALEKVYDEINRLETSVIEHREYARVHDMFLPFLLLAIALFMLEFVLRNTWLKTIP